MDYTKPTLLVISGPNGAGKSTHIQTMLSSDFRGIVSFDRDTVRLGFEKILIEQGVKSSAVLPKATAMMEEELLIRMKQAISKKEHFVLETPLSHPDYWKYIDLFDNAGYLLQLNYLCLDKITDCIARVGQRVMEGGHNVDPQTIKGVYETNLKHINEYSDIFKVIELYDGMTIPTLLARFEDKLVTYGVKQALKKRWIKQGLPNLAKDIKLYLENNKEAEPD